MTTELFSRLLAAVGLLAYLLVALLRPGALPKRLV